MSIALLLREQHKKAGRGETVTTEELNRNTLAVLLRERNLINRRIRTLRRALAHH